MRNVEVAWVLAEMADLMEILGENIYKIRAYRKGAQSIENLEEDINQLNSTGQLEKVDGIGKKLANNIRELLTTGTFPEYEEIKQRVPRGLLNFLAIPGLGPKSVQLIYQHLGITSLDELEEAARSRKIRQLPGMGSKTELAILRGIDLLRNQGARVTLGIADPIAEELTGYLSTLPDVERVSITGSLRRRQELVGDIDLLVASTKPARVREVFVKHPLIQEIVYEEGDRLVVLTTGGARCELLLVAPAQFFPTLLWSTGSKGHYQALQQIALEQGSGLDLTGLGGMAPKEWQSEEDIYRQLGLDYIPPELRENRGEIEAARRGQLPDLLELEHIRGDLHVHTDWSDGVHSLEEMAEAAQHRGYEYLAITDHSKSLAISRGLNEERLMYQRIKIEKLNEEFKDFRLLSGIEVDILSNGALDFSDDVLCDLDVVIASVHTGFKQEREQLTERVVAALKNEHVDILAHPTGRLLGRREPYALDVERVLEVARQTGTILEINASPDRLDLGDAHCRQAKNLGITMAINTDAHDWRRFDDMKYGVATARRGWLTKEDVLNTLPLDKLLKRLGR
ncbi:MAG: DNA polymerase/3'-5' exonuclease PolX [Firmicutes bacterium]|nr:DNA polymerase/3'-5' exonuclease PolX [Bacillota bacterium]